MNETEKMAEAQKALLTATYFHAVVAYVFVTAYLRVLPLTWYVFISAAVLFAAMILPPIATHYWASIAVYRFSQADTRNDDDAIHGADAASRALKWHRRGLLAKFLELLG